MAKRKRKKSGGGGITRRTGGGMVRRAARSIRRKAQLSPLAGAMAAGAASALMGYAEGKGHEIPTLGGLPPALLIGAAAVFAGPMVVKGKTAAAVVAAGAGLVGAGAYQLGHEMGSEANDGGGDDDTGGDDIIGEDEIIG